MIGRIPPSASPGNRGPGWISRGPRALFLITRALSASSGSLGVPNPCGKPMHLLFFIVFCCLPVSLWLFFAALVVFLCFGGIFWLFFVVFVLSKIVICVFFGHEHSKQSNAKQSKAMQSKSFCCCCFIFCGYFMLF